MWKKRACLKFRYYPDVCMDWLRKITKYLIGITGLSALRYQPETSRTRSDIWSFPHCRKIFCKRVFYLDALCLNAYGIRRGPFLWPLGTKNMCEFTHLRWVIFDLEEKFKMAVRIETFVKFSVVLLFLWSFWPVLMRYVRNMKSCSENLSSRSLHINLYWSAVFAVIMMIYRR